MEEQGKAGSSETKTGIRIRPPGFIPGERKFKS